jgi:hypothetical protein
VLVLASEKNMKVNQVVGEHAKGMRAKKYARKPTGTIAPKKPEAPKASDKQGVAEVSQQTLQSYRKKAAKEKNDAMDIVNRDDVDDATWAKNVNKASKRKDGIAAANKRLGLEEGVFGLSAKEKGKIQYVTAKISDIPGNWDHKNQTYTEQGLKDLKSVMKNEKYLKYALSLTADDYEADVGEDATITRADQSGTEITDNDTKVKTVIPPEMKAALAPDAENPNEYDLNTTAVAPGAQQDPNQPPKVGSKVEIKKTAESLDDELLEKIRTIAGLR